MITVALISVVAVAVLLTVLILAYVKDADIRADETLTDEKGRYGVTSMADVTYNETDVEKRVRLGAPKKEDVPANW